MTTAARLSVFLTSPTEVFHSIEHRHAIWREDPFDVDSVHEEARHVFKRLLTRAITPPGVDSGRILLLLGESGSGKTHLVRSFRNYVHANGLGFVGYLQMTTSTTSYGRYLLSNIIDSLDQPYYESLASTSSLMRLSNALASRSLDDSLLEILREDVELGFHEIADFIGSAADRLILQPRYADIDVDLIRALLFLQRGDPRIKSRVIKYLRCEDLADSDRKVLGGLVPKRHDDDPQRMVEHLGRLMWAVDSLALVVCVDQLEDLFNVAEGEGLFRRAIATICALADRVPSSVFVICCLEDYYEEVEKRLTRSMLDRIEHDPEPVRLLSSRSREEVELIVAHRLRWLYETNGVAVDPKDASFPIPSSMLDKLTRLRARDVLERCREYRAQCVEEERLCSFERPTLLGVGPDELPIDEEKRAVMQATLDLEGAWNDHLASHRQAPPEHDAELASLLAWALEACAAELGKEYGVQAGASGETVELLVAGPGGRKRLLLGICNQPGRGGRLARQIELVAEAAGDRVPVFVRSSEFPSGPKGSVSKQLDQLTAAGGRCVVVEDSAWRTMLAYRDFVERAGHPHLGAWKEAVMHLSRLLPLSAILGMRKAPTPNA
jgi:energy-coupling factor transporter ATP-binding protein EcfA2